MKPEQVSRMLTQIYKGKITSRKLPVAYYKAVSALFMNALKTGFGPKKGLEDSYEALADNVYMFSAAKTYQLTREIEGIKSKVETLDAFKEKAQGVFTKYKIWEEAEETTVLASSQQAKLWKNIEKEADIFPMLRYTTIGEACEICSPLDGIVAPVGHKIWAKIYPLNHYECFCTVIQETKDVRSTDQAILAKLEKESVANMNDVFIQNVGMSNEIFTRDHSYFREVPKKDQAFAKRNFDLPFPKSYK